MLAMMPRTAPAATILSSAAPAGEAAIMALKNMAIRNAVARSAVMRSSVADVAGEHAGTDADLLHRPVVFCADVGAENQLGIRTAMQPAIVLQLALELARRPAGIAERQDRARRAGAAGDCFENIECGGEADALIDRQGGVLDEKVGALQHGDVAGARRKLNLLGLGNDVEFYQKVRKVDVRGGLVDDDAHRALRRVSAHVDQATRETLILHAGRCDQHLPI